GGDRPGGSGASESRLLRFSPVYGTKMMNKGAIVELFKDRRVLVIGDAILDVYLSGISTRLCREAPAPVVLLQRREASGGGAANTVVNLATLGRRPSVATVIGADPAGQELREILEAAGRSEEH